MPRRKTIKEPTYQHNITAGWNSTSQRWTSKAGRITSYDKVIEENAGQDAYGFFTSKVFNLTPTANAYGKFEVMSSNLIDPSSIRADEPMSGLANILTAALHLADDPEKKRPANYMLPQVRSRMQLAEHFYMTDGDCANVCDVPVELLARDLVVECPDVSLRKDIEDFIEEKELEDTVGELWRTMRVFGNAFPYETWAGKDLETIVNLKPLFVHVGYNWGYQLDPQLVGEKAWTEQLMESRLPPAMHRALIRHWNDNPPPDGIGVNLASGVPLSGDTLKPLRDREFNWARYSMPMLSRGFRDLTDKTIYEDAMRALIEGHRYQLWVFKLGDKDHPPMPQELKALNAVLGGISGERTGTLVWRNPLEVAVYAPVGLDKMSGNQYHAELTKSFFRKMGITSQVVSGETPGTLGLAGGGRGNTSIDVQIYIERARYQADQVTRWVEYIVKKWASQNAKAVKPLKGLKIKFAPTQLEQETKVAQVFLPLYESGPLSIHTLLSTAGLNYETELAHKKEEQKAVDDGLFKPPATYAQTVVSPSGDTIKETEQTMPKGSPDKLGEARNRMGRKKKTPVEKQEPTGVLPAPKKSAPVESE